MQQISINELKSHPRNNEFFDDITGDKWQELLDSIKKRIDEGKRGNIEPIVITQDKVIVAGHQRVRAFEELGIQVIDAEIRLYDTDDEILLDLLESNIRRRGDVGGSAKKMGMRIRELERLYGIERGGNHGNQYVGAKPNNSALANQSDIASQMGISVDTLQNYKLLSDMIPELSDLVDTGIVTKTTALAMMRNLSENEQEELIASLDTTKKITQREIQKYIDKSKESETQKNDKTDYSLENKNKELQEQIVKLQKDKSDIELLNKTLKSSKEATEKLMDIYKNESEEYIRMKNDMIQLGLQPDGDYNILDLSNSITTLTNGIEELLTTKLSPIRYTRVFPVIKSNQALKRNMENLVHMVNDWCESMADAIGVTTNENIINMEDID